MLLLLATPKQLCIDLAARVRVLRLRRNFTQQALSARAGIAFSTLRKFEQTGQISLERLVMLAVALDAANEFGALFAEPAPTSLDDIERGQRQRQRARRRRGDHART